MGIEVVVVAKTGGGATEAVGRRGGKGAVVGWGADAGSGVRRAGVGGGTGSAGAGGETGGAVVDGETGGAVTGGGGTAAAIGGYGVGCCVGVGSEAVGCGVFVHPFLGFVASGEGIACAYAFVGIDRDTAGSPEGIVERSAVACLQSFLNGIC